MPREIIDTKSSRPQYIRRRAMQWAAVIIVLLVLFVALEYTHVLHIPIGNLGH